MNNKTEINNSILAGNNNKISNVNIGSNKNDSSQQSPKNNPWKSGSFYIIVSILILLVIAIIASQFEISILLIICIASLFLILLIALLQLKNDDKITDKTFLNLCKELLKKITLINTTFKAKKK